MIPNRLNGGMLFARWLAEKLKKIAANKINNLIVSRGLHIVYIGRSEAGRAVRDTLIVDKQTG